MKWGIGLATSKLSNLYKAQVDRTASKVTHPAIEKTGSHPNEVADAFASFYQKLYKETKPKPMLDNIKTLTSLGLPSLPEEVSKQMISAITETEIRQAI